MHGIDFIQDLATIMAIAAVVTLLFNRLHQPVVLGYIAAGVLIGPHTPPFALIHDADTIAALSELGVVFLLFTLGLEFSLRKLARVGATALIAALAEIVLMVWLGYQIGRAFGWLTMDSLFLGAMLAISSTTIIVKALDELGMKRERFAQLVFGVLIVEDILAIGMIALLSGVAAGGALDAGTVLVTLGELSLFMTVSLLVGLLTVPRLLAHVARRGSDEMLLITVLGLCFGFCLLVVKLDYSIALGAFMIGAIMAEARDLALIERLVAPLRDMFSAIFFVSIGLMIDPSVLIEYAWPIAVITVAVVLGKLVSCGLGAWVAGQDGRTAMRVGMGLSQIGEFSFIIAALGVSLKVTSGFLYPIAVAVSAITTLLTPYLIRWADPLSAWLAGRLPAPVARVGGLYTDWLHGLRPRGERAELAALVNSILFKVMLNLAVVVALFLGAAAWAPELGAWLLPWISAGEAHKALIWGGTLLVALPFLIATWRKLKALSLLLAELGCRGRQAGSYSARLRGLLAEAIPVIALAMILLLIAALSGSLLPGTGVLAVTLAVVAVIAALGWRWFVRVHARLQIELTETLAHQGGEPAAHGH